MIVSYVLDPGLFEPKFLSDGRYAERVLQLLKGVQTNGVLLDTGSARLLKASLKGMEKCRGGQADRIKFFLTEVVLETQSGTRTYLARTAEQDQLGLQKGQKAMELLLKHVATQLSADAVIGTPHTARGISSWSKDSGIAVTSLMSYANSEAERKRMEYAGWDRALDEMSEDKRQDLIGKMVRYANRIAIFDPQIGRATKRIDRFKDGVGEILRIWKSSLPPAVSDNRRLEIVTCAGTSPSGFVRPNDAAENVSEKLIQPLRKCFRIDIELTILDDEHGAFHARFLQVGGRAFNFERGFDLFRPGRRRDGTRLPRAVLVAQHPGGPRYLAKVRALRTLYPTSPTPAGL